MFPNTYSVYLHSTPSTELFSRSRRDFSSGCIRLEKPAELASFLLRNQLDSLSGAASSVASICSNQARRASGPIWKRPCDSRKLSHHRC
jgi:murein L,D-transpeptidase YcbB/YkuD